MPWNEDLKNDLKQVASAMRQLSIDGVEKAKSGHPGLPLGCADIAAYLYGYQMKHNPKNSSWIDRDRFILSAGHGSMLLYSCLHLSGFNLSLDQLKLFRQLHSETPGHPESRDTDGVETTTGPLGQGLGNAVGQALGLKLLQARFPGLFDNKVYCLAGDGCMMEGVTSEVSSLAGHLGLDNLVLIYDANKISLDGPLSQSCSEDTAARYESYGWDVYEVNGHDFEEIHGVFNTIKLGQNRPVMIIAHTVIGKGSPHLAGTNKIHGSPMGPEETKLTKEALGLSMEPFYVDPKVREFFNEKLKRDEMLEAAWNQKFQKWQTEHREEAKLFDVMINQKEPANLEEVLKAVEIPDPEATRSSSNFVLTKLGSLLPFLIGGSADLSGSDMTMMKQFPLVAPHDFKGHNIKYGVREFGMATMATGISQTQMLIPFIGTFFTFSDYMRNAIRLACLQRAHVIYQFTHDSIFLGEDGPTHQPVEHLAALRAMPHLHVIRPSDNNEVKMAWIAALKYKGPSAIILSRQKVPTLAHTDVSYSEGMGKGAYVIHGENVKPDFTLVATGTEVSLAMDVAKALEGKGKKARVISMPCWEIFEAQPEAYKKKLFDGDLGKRVSIEAGVAMGWERYVGRDGITIAMKDFGLSAPANELAKEFGFTVDQILEKIL
ncbi:transketolase [Chlamydiales bacterium]|nr:transketolase [Chlamydiales bacterium]